MLLRTERSAHSPLSEEHDPRVEERSKAEHLFPFSRYRRIHMYMPVYMYIYIFIHLYHMRLYIFIKGYIYVLIYVYG
jgi:hypothetical protein